MKEKEYIDRDALLKRNMYGNTNPIVYRSYADKLIKSEPAVDVVEVVRCKDCGYFHDGKYFSFCDRPCERPIERSPNDFCSRGVRKES